MQFEECPKWLAVKDVLGEIETEFENKCQLSENCESFAGCVMLAVQDDRMCTQIRDVRTELVVELTTFNCMLLV